MKVARRLGWTVLGKCREKWSKAIEGLRRIWADEQAITTVEYAILLVLIVVIAIGSWVSFSQTVQNSVQHSQQAVDNAVVQTAPTN